MRTIALIQRNETNYWGGDISVAQLFKHGIESIGHRAVTAESVTKLTSKVDFVFLFNLFLPHQEETIPCKHYDIPYGFIAFYLDFPKFRRAESGFFHFFFKLITKQKIHGHIPSLDDILDSPNWVYLFSKESSLNIFKVLQDVEEASLIVANSPSEKKIIESHFPTKGKTIANYWSIPTFIKKEKDKNPFLDRTGLKKGEYFLQVGRCSSRKNQFATIVALRNHRQPLVLITMSKSDYVSMYTKMCIALCNLYRKGPTFIVTSDESIRSYGNTTVIHTKDKLSTEELADAYENAYMYIHPAFYECPGFTYLEALKANIPVVASEWSTLKDYLSQGSSAGQDLSNHISFCTPHDIRSIEKAINDLENRRNRPHLDLCAFHRTPEDMAKEIIPEIESILT